MLTTKRWGRFAMDRVMRVAFYIANIIFGLALSFALLITIVGILMGAGHKSLTYPPAIRTIVLFATMLFISIVFWVGFFKIKSFRLPIFIVFSTSYCFIFYYHMEMR